jgi:DNA-binding YbaB/EbfC family protein
MNMQAMLQQAQKLQKEMLQAKKEIEEKSFVSKKGIVEIEMKGTKELSKIKINSGSLDKEDIEALEDMIILAINENIISINKETESKLGKFGSAAGIL